MSSFAIFRLKKLKSAQEIKGSLRHTYREQETHNADPAKKSWNESLLDRAADTEQGISDYDRLVDGIKIRKNAVHAVEFLVTGSPERIHAMSPAEQKSYFKSSLEYIGNMMGGKKNIISAEIHNDETTPHLSIIAIPIDENNKLNCKRFLGGKKERLSELQTDFAEKVGRAARLKRGVKNSKAKHQTIAQYYTHLNDFHKTAQQLENNLAKKRFESTKEYEKRVVLPLTKTIKERDSLKAVQEGFDDKEREFKSQIKSTQAKLKFQAEDFSLRAGTLEKKLEEERAEKKKRTEEEKAKRFALLKDLGISNLKGESKKKAIEEMKDVAKKYFKLEEEQQRQRKRDRATSRGRSM